MSNTISDYITSADRAADWLEAQQRSDGAIAPEEGVGAIYKGGAALAAAGRLNAAWRLMDDTVRRFQTEPGEFHRDNENERDRMASLYRTCWILLGALRMGRFDVASPGALDHVYAFQDEKTGGFFATLDPAAQTQLSALHTTMAGWLCLYTARLDRARRAGDWVLDLLARQPDWPKRFYFKMDPKTGECITEYPENASILAFTDTKREKQFFFFSGMLMGYLSDLYRATGDSRYIDGAVEMFAFEQGMNPRGFRYPSKCKVGWGAALLYSVTGEAAQRRLATDVADVTFLEAQCDDGRWDACNCVANDNATAFIEVSATEMTCEFLFELCEIIKALGPA